MCLGRVAFCLGWESAGLAVTDSTGSYWLGACDTATVRYTAIGYETLVLKFPEDLECSDADYCCGRLRDVELTASPGWLYRP